MLLSFILPPDVVNKDVFISVNLRSVTFFIMRRRTEPHTANKELLTGDRRETEERPQTEAQGRHSYFSWIINAGKCLLLIVLVPPFLNYASLQREGQLLLPKDGQMVDIGLGQKMHLLCKGQGKPWF